MGLQPASNEVLWTLGGMAIAVFGVLGFLYVCAIIFTH
jgi:hypothetical protein